MKIDKATFKAQLIANVKTLSRKTIETATKEQLYEALVFTMRDYVTDKWLKTHETYDKVGCKIVTRSRKSFRSLASTITSLRKLSVIPVSATAVSAVLRPVSSIAFPHSSFPLTAAVSATTTVFSSRK